jgi:hypothetical protein
MPPGWLGDSTSIMFGDQKELDEKQAEYEREKKEKRAGS